MNQRETGGALQDQKRMNHNPRETLLESALQHDTPLLSTRLDFFDFHDPFTILFRFSRPLPPLPLSARVSPQPNPTLALAFRLL